MKYGLKTFACENGETSGRGFKDSRGGISEEDKPEGIYLITKQSADSDMMSSKQKDEVKPSVTSMMSVLHSINRMKNIRQRTQAAKGNITSDIPMRKFNPTEVCREIDRILTTTLSGVHYDPKRASVLSRSLSESIKGKVKTMKFPRYKFIVMVTITSKSSQGLFVGSQSVWNADTDSYATGKYCNGSLIAVASVHAVLKE